MVLRSDTTKVVSVGRECARVHPRKPVRENEEVGSWNNYASTHVLGGGHSPVLHRFQRVIKIAVIHEATSQVDAYPGGSLRHPQAPLECLDDLVSRLLLRRDPGQDEPTKFVFEIVRKKRLSGVADGVVTPHDFPRIDGTRENV